MGSFQDRVIDDQNDAFTIPDNHIHPDDKYALSESWTHHQEFKEPFDHTVEESGQTVLLRRLDMGDLLKLGIAEEMDFMSKELMTSEQPDKPKEAVSSAVMKADNFKNMEKMINLVVSAGVIKPKLYMTPVDEEHQKRQAGLLYVDSVPFGDRMELFSIIFDSEGLSTFREEQETGVGNVEHVESVQLPTDDVVAVVRSDDTERVLSE